MTSARWSPLAPLPSTYAADRSVLRLVATHVLARARFQAVGRFGLVATPGGFGTPAFGPDATVVRLAAAGLAVERGGETSWTPWAGATVRSLAVAAGADVDVDLSVGADTPPLGDPDAPLSLDPASVTALGGWLAMGWAAIDAVTAIADAGTATDLAAPAGGGPARTQLWPEHFDAGTNVAVGPGADDRANLGAAAGDDGFPEPYLYVGPWGDARPGPAGYWNAPFGAVLGHAELIGADDPLAAATSFLTEGLARLRDPG